jgi:hypothetical protein
MNNLIQFLGCMMMIELHMEQSIGVSHKMVLEKYMMIVIRRKNHI